MQLLGAKFVIVRCRVLDPVACETDVHTMQHSIQAYIDVHAPLEYAAQVFYVVC